MIVDKVKPFYTDAELEELETIRKQAAAIDRQFNKQIAKAIEDGDKERAEALSKERDISFWREVDIMNAVEARYIASLDGDPAAILADAAEIVGAITKQDYDAYRERLLKADSGGKLAARYTETADGAAGYILQHIRVQLNAIASDQESTDAAKKIVFRRALELYPQEDEQTPEAFCMSVKDLENIKYRKTRSVILPTDKSSAVLFGPEAPRPKKKETDGQISFTELKYEKDGAPEITLFYNYSFDEEILSKLGLEKKIDDEDFFILSLIFNCKLNNNTRLSISKLYREMTGDDPNKNQLTNFTNRLVKLASTTIYMNDKEVREAWNADDANNDGKTYHDIVAPLAPIVISTERFITSGKVVDGGVKITDFPVLMKLGYDIKQYTTVPKELLQVKKKNGRAASRTPRFYRSLHYLVRRIAQMKNNNNLSNRILYASFFEKTGITSARDNPRAKNTLYEILEHFRRCEWITGYKETQNGDGVTIYYKPKQKKIVKK